jgi:hypothetical protein
VIKGLLNKSDVNYRTAQKYQSVPTTGWLINVNVTNNGGIQMSHSGVVDDSSLSRCGSVCLGTGLLIFRYSVASSF